MKRSSQVLRKLALAFVLVTISYLALAWNSTAASNARVRTELESRTHQLQETKKQLESTEAQSAQQQQEHQKKIDEVNKQLEETKRQLQAKRSAAVVYAAPAPPTTGVTNCGDNPYKQFIYKHESGCNTAAINKSSGACGIGQAWPCSKLPCSLSDWACQDRFFSDYAIKRYGSWQAAYNFWVANRWW